MESCGGVTKSIINVFNNSSEACLLYVLKIRIQKWSLVMLTDSLPYLSFCGETE
jgi:hypothetical protein